MKVSLPPQAAPRSTPETRARNTSDKPYTNPFSVIVDTRESAPFTFANLRANSSRSYRPLHVPVVRACLTTGDYSLVGFSVPSPANSFHAIVIERKSLADLFGSLAGPNGERRKRFKAEHERMQADYILHGGQAHVVIEGRYDELDEFYEKNGQRGQTPEGVRGTEVRWFARYGVPWHFAGSRTEAEKKTFRLLEHFWELHRHELQILPA